MRISREDLALARQEFLSRPEDSTPDRYPELTNVPAGCVYNFVPVAHQPGPVEFAFYRFDPEEDDRPATEVLLADWNILWEAAQFRREVFSEKHRFAKSLPDRFAWLRSLPENSNIYLLHDHGQIPYDAYAPLYHLLPKRTLERFQLPVLVRGTWPPSMHLPLLHVLLPTNFMQRLQKAFAHHIWPLIDRGSSMKAYSRDDSLVLLTHNLDFWLPFAYKVAEEIMRSVDRVPYDNADQEARVRMLNGEIPADISFARPRYGGPLWKGEDEAWQATRSIVEQADRGGRLSGIVDAIRSCRVPDDFSPIWSNAKEDFERKLHRKRSKVKVSFVQLDNTIPVHGAHSEIVENLLWEDFMTFVNPQDRRIVVCLRNGLTRVGDISDQLGYANHSPVSKALSRIRRKAVRFFNLN